MQFKLKIDFGGQVSEYTINHVNGVGNYTKTGADRMPERGNASGNGDGFNLIGTRELRIKVDNCAKPSVQSGGGTFYRIAKGSPITWTRA